MAKKRHILAIFTFIIIGCANVTEQIIPTEPSFNNYISIGGSYTAGVSNGVLNTKNQLTSFPNLIAQQLSKRGGGSFIQPLLENGTEVPYNQTTTISKYKGSCNNYGLPAFKIYSIFKNGLADDSQAGFSPFLNRIATESQKQKNYVDIIKELNPTLISIEFGLDEVFDYIVSGGVKPYTDYTVFHTNFSVMLDQLSKTNAKILVANVPNFLTTATLSYSVDKLPQVLRSKDIYIQLNTGKVRKATSNDRFLKTGIAIIGKNDENGNLVGFSEQKPLPNKYIIDENELADLKKTISFYNASIEKLCTEKQIAVVDIFGLFSNIQKSPIEVNNIKIEAIEGSFYSGDGILTTNVGNILIANEFIKVLNLKYNFTVPLLEIK